MEDAATGCVAGCGVQSRGQRPRHHDTAAVAAAAAGIPRKAARPGGKPTGTIQPPQPHPRLPGPQLRPREEPYRVSTAPRLKRPRDEDQFRGHQRPQRQPQDQRRQAVRRRVGEVYAKTVFIDTPPDLASVFAELDAANAAGCPAGSSGGGDVRGDGGGVDGDGRVARASDPWGGHCSGAGAGIGTGAGDNGGGGIGNGCGDAGGPAPAPAAPAPKAPAIASNRSLSIVSPGACSTTVGRSGSPLAHQAAGAVQAIGTDCRDGLGDGGRRRGYHSGRVLGGSGSGGGGFEDRGSLDGNSRGGGSGSGGIAPLDLDSLAGADPLPELPASGGGAQPPPDVIDLTAASDCEEDAGAAAGSVTRQREPPPRRLVAQGTATPPLQPQWPSKPQPPPPQSPPRHEQPQQQPQPPQQQQQLQPSPGGADERRLQRLGRLKGLITLSREARQQHETQLLLAMQFMAQQYLAKQQQQQQPSRPCERPLPQEPLQSPPPPSHQEAEQPPHTSPVEWVNLPDWQPEDPPTAAIAADAGPRGGGPDGEEPRGGGVCSGPRDGGESRGGGPGGGDVRGLAATALAKQAPEMTAAAAAAVGTPKPHLAEFQGAELCVAEAGVTAVAAAMAAAAADAAVEAASPPAGAPQRPPAPPSCGPQHVIASRTQPPYIEGCRSEITEVANAAETLLRLCADSARWAADRGARVSYHGGGDGGGARPGPCERRAGPPASPPQMAGLAPASEWRGGGCFYAQAPLQPPPPQPPPRPGFGTPQGVWAAAQALRPHWVQAPLQPQWPDCYLLPPPAPAPPPPPLPLSPPGQQLAHLLLQQHRHQELLLQQLQAQQAQRQRQREQPKKRRGRPPKAACGKREPQAPPDVAPVRAPRVLPPPPPPPLKQQQPQQRPQKRRWGRPRKME